MEWVHWLQSPMGAVISAVGGWIAIDAVVTRLSTLLTIGSIIRTVWNWIRGKRPDSNESQISSLNLTREIHNTNSALTDSQQVIGNHDVVIGKITDNAQVHIGDAITHDNRKIVNNWKLITKIFHNDRKRPAPQESPRSQKGRVAGLDALPSDAQPVGTVDVQPGEDVLSSPTPDDQSVPAQENEPTPTEAVHPAEPELPVPPSIVPVVTPFEAQPHANSVSDNASASPASAIDGRDNPSNDMASVTDTDVPTEIQLSGQEPPAIEAQQAIADVQSAPTSNDDANVKADITTGEGADSDTAEVEPAMPLDQHSTPSADLANDTNLPTPDEVVRAIDDVTAQAYQACVEEAPQPTRNPDGFTDQPAKESPDTDGSQDANADATASIAEAISETQRIVPIDEREVTSIHSGEQASEIDQVVSSLAQAFATPEVDAEADGIDEDIGDIADEWPAPAISATLKRLRQARGLLPADLSYDVGWVITFEADRWHTAQTDRWRYIRGIRTYLQALGMTPEEMRGCLRSLTRRE